MRIAIEDAISGMVLTDDVVLPDGSGTVGKSSPLNNDDIIRIMLAGVTHISITDRGVTPTDFSDLATPPAPAKSAATPPGSAKSAATPPEPEKAAALPPETSKPAGTPPVIKVCIAEDAMSAWIVIEPAGNPPSDISAETIRAALEENDVASGINEPRLLEIAQEWNGSKKQCRFDDVALGTVPKPGKQAPYHFNVPHLGSSRELEAVRKSRGYWEAIKRVGNLHRVNKDCVAAEKRFETPPQKGMTVRGDPVNSDEPAEEIYTMEAGVALSKDGMQLVAERDGILYCVDNTIGIVPLNFDGSFELLTDKMAARLVIHPAGEGGIMPAEKELRNLLANNLIVYGVREDVIEEVLAKISDGEIPAEPVVIAEGLAPEHGRNGSVEFLFNTKTSLAPKINPDGSCDYKNVDLIVAVPKGKELVRLHAPVQGIPGKTIFGENIPCKEGAPATLPVGPNTEPLHDRGVLVASKDGIARLNGAVVEVCEGYVIKGDVDYSTGNIKYDKSVVINGDVKAGFSIDCGGDLQVSGIVEDCTVNVGGHVLCKHGFIGHGSGIISAKGDVNIGFILHQTVKSRQNVNIAREAINPTIYSGNSIVIHGNPLSIAGGTLIARESITVYTVGNHSGVHTTLEVGLDFELLEELKKTEATLADLAGKHGKLADSMKIFQRKLSLGKKLGPQEAPLYEKLKSAIEKFEEEINILGARKTNIEATMHELDKAYVKIEHAAMPGTTLKIGKLNHFCKDEVIGPKTARIVKGEITIV